MKSQQPPYAIRYGANSNRQCLEDKKTVLLVIKTFFLGGLFLMPTVKA